MPRPEEPAVLVFSPRKLSLEEALKRLCARHGLEFAFWKKYTLKTDMTMMFNTVKNAYWTVTAHVETWMTPEEHDDLFYDALEVALELWLKAHPSSER